MSETPVNVTITANPGPFIEGMQQATAASQQAAVGIDTNLTAISAVAEQMVAAAQATMARIQMSALETNEAARIATVQWNAAKAQIVEAETVLAQVEAAADARRKLMVQTSLAQAAATEKVAEATRFSTAAEMAQVEWTDAESAAYANNIRIKNALQIVQNQIAISKEKEVAAAAAIIPALNEEAAAYGRVAISSRTAYEVGVLTSEAASGNFARMQRSLAALGNSTGILQELASLLLSIPAPVYAAALALGAFEFAVIKGSQETTAYAKALEVSNNASGQSAEGLRNLTASIGESLHNWGAAKEAVLAFASSGKVAQDSFELVAKGAVALSELTGKSIKEVTEEFEKLGEDPVKNVAKLNEAYHFLTAAQFEEIDAMKKSGDVAGATAEAQKLLADAAIERIERVEKSLPPLVQWWHNVQDAANLAWDAMKHTGDDSLTSQLGYQIKVLGIAQETLAMYAKTRGTESEDYKRQAEFVDQLTETIKKQQAVVGDDTAQKKAAAAAKAREDAENQAAIKAQMDIDALTLRYGKEETAIEKVARAQSDLVKIWEATGKLPSGMEMVDNRVQGPAWDDLVEHIKKGTDSYKEAQKEARNYAQGLKELEPAQTRASELTETLTGKTDAASEAWAKHNNAMLNLVEADDKVLDIIQKLIDNAPNEEAHAQAQAMYANYLADAREREAAAAAASQAATERKIASMKNEESVYKDILVQYQREEELAGLSSNARRIEEQVMRAEDSAMKELHLTREQFLSQEGPLIEKLKQEAAAHEAAMEQIQLHKKVLDDLVHIAESGFSSYANTLAEFVTHSIKSWKDFGKALLDDTKRFIAEMIAEFLKLAFINQFMNNLFGGFSGYQTQPTLMSLAGGAISGTGTGGQITSLLGGSPGGGFGSGIGNWLTNLFSGGSDLGGAGVLTTEAAANAGLVPGSYLGAGLGGETAITSEIQGMTQATSSFASTLGTVTELFKTWAPVLGAALVGYQVGGVAGAIGLGVAAYFIPVVGWIAAAAGIVNQLTGGGLFGTDWKPTGASDTTVSIDEFGANVQNSIGESKKKSLFRGRSWRNVDVPASAEQISGAEDLQSALQTGLNAFIDQVHATAQSIVSGSFTTSTDTKGKQTTKSVVAGVEYDNETSQQFASRMQSENFIKVLDSMGLEASKFVAGVQKDADKLAAAVQDFATVVVNAQANLEHGFKFMALGADQTLVDVMKFVEGLKTADETLAQTYQRLAKAQQDYDKFVGQFKTTTYVDSFEASMSQLYHQMLDNTAQANALAQAAGAAGASQEDLTNIQKYAAVQMAQLIVQTQEAAQELAFSLGLTLQGSLSQVNEEIARLQGEAGTSADSAAKSLGTFVSAVGDVATKVNQTIQLLLGNLSPLNDQQKLQVALQGLRAGTASEEDVLQIGRRLYASSQAYTDLFNQVEHMAKGVGTGGTAGKGQADNAIGSYVPNPEQEKKTLSPEDQAKLDALLKEKAVLEAAQTSTQFHTLAQQIAEIATAKGETISQVIEEMGINQQDLEKGLGIKTDEDFAAYMDKLQKQVDSAKENTQSIVAAINMLPQHIAEAIDGTLGVTHASLGNPTNRAAPPIGTGSAVSGPGGGGNYQPPGDSRPLTTEDLAVVGDVVGKAVGRTVAPLLGNTRRNGR